MSVIKFWRCKNKDCKSTGTKGGVCIHCGSVMRPVVEQIDETKEDIK